MSKKLIAVAAAAALALTGLVATPASATTITSVIIDTSVNGGGTADVASHTSTTSAVTAATAMTSRSLDFADSSSVSRNVVRFTVSTASATTITVTSAGGVEVSDALVDAAAKSYTIDRNLTTLSKVTSAGSLSYTFYAYTTSTTAGSLVIETPSTKRTYYVKSLAGEAYNLTNVKFPTSITSGQADDDDNTNIVTWNTTDLYGNSIETAQGALTAFGATTPSVTAAAWQTATKVNRSKIHGSASSSIALSLNITPKSLTALGHLAPVKSVFVTVSAGSITDQLTAVNAQVTALTAQIAALTAQLANSRAKEESVTKKKYNSLARKWNASNPSARVALKK